jgi:hypothetical protein
MSSKHTKSQLALQIRHHPEADHTDLRRQLKAQVLEEKVRKVVDSAPPLSIEQRAKIAAILLTGGDADCTP